MPHKIEEVAIDSVDKNSTEQRNTSHPCFECGLMFARRHDFEQHMAALHSKLADNVAQPKTESVEENGNTGAVKVLPPPVPLQNEENVKDAATKFRLCDQCGMAFTAEGDEFAAAEFGRHQIEHDLVRLIKALYEHEVINKEKSRVARSPSPSLALPTMVACKEEEPEVDETTSVTQPPMIIQQVTGKIGTGAEASPNAHPSEPNTPTGCVTPQYAAVAPTATAIVTPKMPAAKRGRPLKNPQLPSAAKRKSKTPLIPTTVKRRRRRRTIAVPTLQAVSHGVSEDFVVNDNSVPNVGLTAVKTENKTSDSFLKAIKNDDIDEQTLMETKLQQKIQPHAPAKVLSSVCPYCNQQCKRPWLLIEHMVDEHGSLLISLTVESAAGCKDFENMKQTAQCDYCQQNVTLDKSAPINHQISLVLMHVLKLHRDKLFVCPPSVVSCEIRFEVLSTMGDEAKKFNIKMSVRPKPDAAQQQHKQSA